MLRLICSTFFSGVVFVLGAVSLAGATPPVVATNADADVKIIETVRPQFPLNLQRQGVGSGEVRLMLEVDAKGVLTDCLITAFTRKEFAYEAGKAVNAWRFQPARLGGQAVSSAIPLTITFLSNGALAVIKQFDQLPRQDPRYEYAPCASSNLDRTPGLLAQVPPLYPKQISDQGVTGRVALDFFIDETGRVRFPVAREPAEPRLAGLAIRALKLWMFEPPTRGGVPVLTRATTSFAFDPPP